MAESVAALAAALLLLAVSQQGCEDIYRLTCVWHSDLNIRGCSYYGYRGCIQNCHYCITNQGPDECGQVKCAALCAKQDGSECLTNFKALCDIALEEQFKVNTTGGGTAYTCDVNCNSSGRLAPSSLLLLLLGVLWMPSLSLPLPSLPSPSSGRWRYAVGFAVLAMSATMLQGCGCVEPTAHLEWRPDGDSFNQRTERMVDGIWRGNPSWIWHPHLESEDYQCVTMHSNGFCEVWTMHEWNCGEHDFGVCKCHEIATNGNYCKAWSCHALEADQQICELRRDDDGETVSCWYSPFHMNWDVYDALLERQSGGALTTGETVYRWWSYGSAWSADLGRRLEADQEAALIGDYLAYLEKWNATALQTELQHAGLPTKAADASRRLQTSTLDWPPLFAYNPAARHVHFWWGDVCIVNGDNTMIARRTCARWREIETEIQMCRCKTENYNGKSCAEWTCEERDVGLFSVLFRTKQSIDQYTLGVEFESYRCTGYDIDGNCQSWEGDIESLEEVEWSKCFCPPSGCQSQDAVWLCDEWELPKTRDLFYEGHIGGLIAFIFAECFCSCLFFKADEAGDALLVASVASWCGGLILLPFLVLTYGFYGFLFCGGFFWFIRIMGCCCLIATTIKIPKYERPSNKVRMQRGASKILGRGGSRSIQPGEVKEPEPSNEPTNETNNVNA